MAKDISIAIAIKDNYTDTMKKLSASTRAFDKDLDGAQRRLDAINKGKTSLCVDVTQAKRELKDAQKAFDKTSDSINRAALVEKQLNFDNVTRNMGALKKAATDAEKEIKNLTSTSGKAQNRAGAFAKVKEFGGLASSFGALEQVKSVGMNGLNYISGSAGGSETGNVLGQALSGGINGAVLGASVAGPIGAVVGGVVSAGLGAINGGIENAQKRDENFKSIVQEQYNTSQQTQADTLTNGSDIAANREIQLQSFTTMFKDADVAKGFMDEMKDFANVTPFEFDDLTGMAKTLKVYGYEVNELKPMMEKIGDAGSALGMGQDGMNMVATAIGRIQSTGKPNLEYLNILMERGIPAVEYMAKALGKSEGAVYDMVSKGLIPGAEAAQIITDSMGAEFAGSMEAQSKKYIGLTSTLKGMNDELANAMGHGYNEERKIGITQEIAFKSGENGEKHMIANEMIGKWKGSLENTKAQIAMDMQEAVMSGLSVEKYGLTVQTRLAEMNAKYKEISASGKTESGAEMGALLAEAQVMAENEYMASEGALLEQKTQIALVGSLREDAGIKGAYTSFGNEMAIEFSKGIHANKGYIVAALSPSTDPVLDPNEPYQRDNVNAPKYGEEPKSPSPDMRQYMGSHAAGLERVPYNNYPALLHEGERVQTAAQARASKSGVNITIGGTFHIREEADIDRVAEQLAAKLERVKAVTI